MSKSQQISLDEEMWAQALAEFEGESRRPGLWAKSYAEAEGNETVAKAAYLRQRVSELIQERIDNEAKLQQKRTDNEAELQQEYINNVVKKSPTEDEIMQALVLMGISPGGERYYYPEDRSGQLKAAINHAITAYDDADGYTWLMKAVRAGDIGLVRALISLGADTKPTAFVYGNPTALDMAVTLLNEADDQHTRKTYQTIIDVLSNVDDSLSIKDKSHQEHIDIEIDKKPTSAEVRKAFESIGGSFDGEQYHFHGSRYDRLEDTIKYNANTYDENGYTALMKAAGVGEIGLVRALIEYGANTKLSARIGGRPTAVQLAIATKNLTKDQNARNNYQEIIDVLNGEDAAGSEQGDESSPTNENKSFVGSTPHPWRRLFARTTDFLFIGLIVYMLFMVLLFIVFTQFPHSMQDPQSVINRFFKLIEERPGLEIIVSIPIVILLWTLLEAAFISLARATPGKWIFGIRVISSTGDKLSYANALKRTFLVLVQGEGFSIPIVNIFTRIFAYLRLTKTGTTLWDTSVGSIVTYKKWGVIRAIVSVLFVLVSLFFLAVLNSM